MKAYQLYLMERKVKWNIGADSIEEAQIIAAAKGEPIPDLPSEKDLSPKELRKFKRMKKYLGG